MCYIINLGEEKDTICYADSSCSVKLGVCDFRETVWWVHVMDARNKEWESIKLTKRQLEEVCKRVSVKYERIFYEDRVGLVKGDKYKIEELIDILEIK